MRTPTRLIAALGLVLILPAAIFMMALAVRGLWPLHSEPARLARLIVTWYAGRVWTLWLLLLSLPLAALVTGSAALLRSWHRQVAATTLASAGILVIVVLHMLAN